MLKTRSLIVLVVMLTQALVMPVGSHALENYSPQADVPLNPGDDAPFDWWMEPRYEAGWWAYSEFTHTYDSEYVYPTGWDVGFDVCGTPIDTAGNTVTYTWETTRTDIGYVHTVQVDDCRFDQASDPKPPRLPQQGVYDVTLTVAYSDQPSQTVSGQIQIKDILIVSIGDSNASGEGNPMTNIITPNPPPDIWWDTRCHRSYFSGPAFTAQRIEGEDPHTSVTFLSFACSGAEVLNGLVFAYDGVEPSGPDDSLTVKPPAQLKSIMNHLCQTSSSSGECIDSPRQIDSLFISIGINDLKFSRIIKSCAAIDKITDWDTDDLFLPGVIDIIADFDWDEVKDRGVDILFGFLDELTINPLEWLDALFGTDFFDCTDDLDPLIKTNLSALWLHYELFDTILDGDVTDVLNDINGQGAADDGTAHPFHWLSTKSVQKFNATYGDLSSAKQRVLTPKEVYITSYPRDVFHDENNNRGGCGFMGAISEDEANWIYDTGAKLNNHIAFEAEKHGWYYVGGITELFDTHGYCSSSSWYVQLFRNFFEQGFPPGAVHPTVNGHNATAERLYARYIEDKPSFATKYGVTVTFEKARIIQSYNGQVQTPGPRNLVLKVEDRWGSHGSTLASAEVPANDWYEFPQADEFSYTAHLNYYEKLYVTGILNSVTALIIDQPDSEPCDDPTCVEPMEPLGLKTKRMYWADNEYGRATDWCVPTSTTFGRYENLCTVTVSTESNGTTLTMDLVYRINMVRIDLFLDAPGEDWRVCADFCDGGVSAFYPSLSQGIQVLSEAGENTQLEEENLKTVLYHTTPLIKTSQDFLRDDDRSYAVAIQPDDGKILVAGYAKTPTIFHQQVTLARYNAVGELDTTFGEEGLVLAGLHDTDAGFAVTVAPDGKIVVAGTRGSSDVDFAAWRFDADGSLDGSFDLLGFNVVDFGQGNDYGRAVIVQPDNKVIIAGYASDGKSYDFALARLDANGTLDTTFGDQGRVRTDLGTGIVRAYAAARQQDGKIVVVGRLDGDIVAVRYLPDGGLDRGFGRSGIATFAFDGNQYGTAVTILPNGYIAIAGYADNDFGLLIVHEDGRPCTTSCGLQAFNPIITTDFGASESAADITVQPDGKIVVVGGDRVLSDGSDLKLARYRFTRAGYQLDHSFGDNGQRIIDIGPRDSARAVAIDNRGQIVVAGSTENGAGDDLALVRYTSGLRIYRTLPEPKRVYLPLVLR